MRRRGAGDDAQNKHNNDSTDENDEDDEDEVFNPIERFQQSRGETTTSKSSESNNNNNNNKSVKKLKFVIKPAAAAAAAASTTSTSTIGKEGASSSMSVQSTREMFEKFSLKPPPGFSSAVPSSSTPALAEEEEEKEEEKKKEEEEEEINEGWLTHGNDAWQETRGEDESEREEKYVEELTHTAKKKYGKYAFVEEASSPSGILSDLRVEEPLEFDSVKTKVKTRSTKEEEEEEEEEEGNSSNRNNKGREEKEDVSELYLLESSMENDPFRSDDELDVARKLELRDARNARSPNEDQVAHAKVLVQAGIIKFNLNDLGGALRDFQNACVLLRDNYHSGDIAFAKAKTHLVAAFLILKCEENKGNVDLCAKLARTLATVTYMADESVFGGFSQQFLLSPKLICRCLRFASAKNFHAKYYLAAKEYLEILLKPFFCADPSTEAALNGMKTQCENAEKQQHGTTRKVDEMESQKRVLDIIDELYEEARF